MPRPRTDRTPFYSQVSKVFGDTVPETITRKQVYAWIEKGILTEAECRWLWTDSKHETKTRGVYRIYPKAVGTPRESTAPAPTPAMTVQAAGTPAPVFQAPAPVNTKSSLTISDPTAPLTDAMAMYNGAGLGAISFVPTENPSYVPFGIYEDLYAVIKSRRFFPVFIAGLSGNGKTETVKQVCAELGREFFRVNITNETDEFDLFGGFHLEQGNTVFRYGPVVEAMKRGAVLLLDEIDLGSTKIMCLQPVLEGNPVFLKKIGELVRPAPGFTIIATANTKGQGDTTGKFHGTENLNEAFLERFAITMEQDYPSTTIERKILNNYMAASGMTNDEDAAFVDVLTRWGAQVRDTYREGGTTEVITTRRLVQAVNSYNIFGRDRIKAVEYACKRFDKQTSESFIMFYRKLDETLIGSNSNESNTAAEVAAGALHAAAVIP